MPDSKRARSAHQRQCDALDLVERALCLIDSAGAGESPYARHLQQAVELAAESGIVATNYGGRDKTVLEEIPRA